MLKPKKKIKKREVEKEPLVERVEKVEEFITNNSKLVTGLAVGLVVVVLVVILMFRSKAKANRQASGELGIAELSLARGDTSDAVLRLEDITAQYPGTNSASFAYALLGKIALSRGNYIEAEDYFNNYLKENKKKDIFTVQVLNNLANCYYIQGDYSAAAQKYLEAAELSPYAFQKNSSLLNAAQCYLKSSELERVQELVSRIKNNKPKENEIKTKLDQLENQLAARNI
ncbi:MAG: tetratricopeptide repeat protein [Candidatus Marinimicrobia bacterium]|nr:tetratricopeptide repeat protein [Candidatus Neomarinimicrobiota bacterium]